MAKTQTPKRTQAPRACHLHVITLLASCIFSLALLFFANCTGNHLDLAEDLKRDRNYEEALDHYLKALKSHPRRVDLKMDIDRLLKEASRYYYLLGAEQEKMGKKATAVLLYKKSLDFDPANHQSREALGELVERDSQIENIERIRREMELNVGLPAVLKSEERMDLKFENKTSLVKIFKVLAQSGKVNILFDSEFRDRPMRMTLRNVTFFQALERICAMNRCRYYILDNDNILVTRDTSDSRKRYRKLLVKNIYFLHADAGEAKQVIESVYRPEKLILNKLTNSLIVNDTVENLSLIEKLARFIDKRSGEVEIEVEIVEMDKKKLKEYGTELSTYQVGLEVDGLSEGKRINDLYYLGADEVRLSMPRMVWKFFSSATDSRILARPRVRGVDRKQIEIRLGEKRPIPRTTFVPVASGGLDQQPITSYDLKDVGISLAITPFIHYNREVTLDLSFELTYVTDFGGAYVPPTLGNRKVTTTLRLKDGETAVMAGLTRGSSTGSSDGIPLLSRIPLLKEIFSSRTRVNEKTDILLSITPRILRMPRITREDLETYLMGTGTRVELKKWQGYDQNR